MLYSHNGKYPQAVPSRIRLSNGDLRTDPTSFTPEELADAGYMAAPDKPAYDADVENLSWSEGAWVVSAKTQVELDEILASERIAAKAAMIAWIEEFLSQFTDGVPKGEELSWPAKAPAARAFLNGTATADQVTLLGAEAQAMGVPVSTVAQSIVANADIFEPVVGITSGLRRSTAVAIDASNEPWAVLEQAKTTALAKAAELGIV